MARVQALAYVADQRYTDLDAVPDASTMAQLDAFQAELAGA